MTYRITVAVATEPLLLAEARLHIKADSDTSEDSLVTAWITAAREIAEHYTGRALAAQTVEQALDDFPWYGYDANGGRSDYIELDLSPASSVTSIKYTDTAGTEQTLSTTYYALSPYGDANRIDLKFAMYWPITQRVANAVRIVYVTGYSTAPKAVKAALQLMVAWFNEHRGDEMDPNDIQPPAAKALLDTVKVWSK